MQAWFEFNKYFFVAFLNEPGDAGINAAATYEICCPTTVKIECSTVQFQHKKMTYRLIVDLRSISTQSLCARSYVYAY